MITDTMKAYIGVSIPTQYGHDIKVTSFSHYNKYKVGIFNFYCPLCSEDKELCPEPFTINTNSIQRGLIPCLCSKNPHHSKEQWDIRIQRYADSHHLSFKGWYNQKITYKNSAFLVFTDQEGKEIKVKGRVILEKPPVRLLPEPYDHTFQIEKLNKVEVNADVFHINFSGVEMQNCEGIYEEETYSFTYQRGEMCSEYWEYIVGMVADLKEADAKGFKTLITLPESVWDISINPTINAVNHPTVIKAQDNKNKLSLFYKK